ncbi:uncharacterized protein IL334_005065 [Kwoniella shivajii]|uniref:Cytoplasmic protein n=1 Tax=Kwoniella shivajii TaxID=564305 RepID=A0ABZ1D3W7_9TREE|nr:hypothetical protein IL334_005065 [Kwoniella shivajii]
MRPPPNQSSVPRTIVDFALNPRHPVNDGGLHKPTIGEKLSGRMEEVVGKITKDEQKVIEGEAKRTGQTSLSKNPEEPSDDPRETHDVHSKDEDRHSESHEKISPHLIPSETHTNEDHYPINPKSEGNINIPSHKTHEHRRPALERDEDEDKIYHSGSRLDNDSHGQGTYFPPSNPYVNESNDHATGRREGNQVQGSNIPLPPSHQNSYAFSPDLITPGGKGEPSFGYMAHGGLPNQPLSAQHQISAEPGLGLDQGGVVDRDLVQPETGAGAAGHA